MSDAAPQPTGQKTTPPKSRESPSKLYQAIDEAQLLLAYAAEQAKALPDEQVEVIIQAKHLKKRDKVTQSLEIKFWQAYRVLAEEVQPVTVESLKATSDEFGDEKFTYRLSKPRKKMAKSRQAVRKYGLSLLFSLLTLLLVQIYVVFGSTIIKDIDPISNRTNDLKLEITLLNAQLATAENPELLLSDIIEKENSLLIIQDPLYSNHELLKYWLSINPWYWGVRTSEETLGTEETLLLVSSEVSRQRALQLGRITLEAISTYVLPLLYGLLGACAYILRLLAREIRAHTYTEQSNIRFQLRMYLGALSGLAVVWVIPGEISIGLEENITRLALAFLAGYSVEIVFAAMDALVGAFSREKM